LSGWWKNWVVCGMAWAFSCAFAGETGERDALSKLSRETYDAPALYTLFDIAKYVDSAGTISTSVATSSSASVPVKISAPIVEAPSAPAATGERVEKAEPKVSSSVLGSALSSTVATTTASQIAPESVRDVPVPVAANESAPSTTSPFSQIGNAQALSDIFTPVSKGSYLKGSFNKPSLSAAALKASGKAGPSALSPIASGKTGEKEDKPAKEKDALSGLDPNAAATSFGRDDSDYLSALTDSQSYGDDDDSLSKKLAKDAQADKDAKEKGKETPQEKAEREEKLLDALSGEPSEKNYGTVADQIQSNAEDVKKMVLKDPARRKQLVNLIDQFAPKDSNKARGTAAVNFGNFLEREGTNPGLLDDIGSASTIRPTHNDR